MASARSSATTLLLQRTVSLNGDWNYIVDVMDTGYLDHFGALIEERGNPLAQKFGIFYDGHLENKNDWIEYGFTDETVMKVPGDWNSQVEKLFYYEGSVWFRKKFRYAARHETPRVFIHFGGANYRADVYLNGRKLGFHEGGFTPFAFEATDVIREGDNSLVVRVNNIRAREAVPTLNTDWWNYGGITRDVTLCETPPAFIEDFTLNLDPKDPALLMFSLKLNGAASGSKAVLRIREAGIEKTFDCAADGLLAASLRAEGLTLWSPETPKLYQVEVEACGAVITDRIGFKTVCVKGTDILLNGKPVFLRGISIHEENPMKGSRAKSMEEARMLLGWAKELNCNFVRLAHYPHNEHMVRAADQMGLLVWSEIPVYWLISWENPRTLENALAQLTDNILRDRNRVSVIIWSMANETPPGPARNKFLRTLAQRARELDSFRLISAALEKHYELDDPETAVVEDPFAEACDVVGFNEYVGWYDGLPEKCSRVKWRINYDKPVIVSEFGGDAKAGLHGKASERWTEEFQEEIYKQTIGMLRKIPQLRGVTPWILADFRAHKRMLPHIQEGWNRKGLVGEGGLKKLAFKVLQAWYAGIKTAAGQKA